MLAVLSIASPVTCAGWEERARDRMACCQRAGHGHCDDQRAADACCAGGEQREQPGTQAAGTLPAPLFQLIALLPAPLDGSEPGLAMVRYPGRRLAPLPASPPGFFGPPLRI